MKEKLPPTDSRLRPDQRALEQGDTETAIKEKHRLEESQRARRKKHQEDGTHHVPWYFDEKTIPETGETLWLFNGLYWEDRAKRDWSRVVQIFD